MFNTLYIFIYFCDQSWIFSIINDFLWIETSQIFYNIRNIL